KYCIRKTKRGGRSAPSPLPWSRIAAASYEHPLVLPQVAHLRQVPLRTRVKLPHSPQASPSYPFRRASRMRSRRASVAWASAVPATAVPAAAKAAADAPLPASSVTAEAEAETEAAAVAVAAALPSAVFVVPVRSPSWTSTPPR